MFRITGDLSSVSLVQYLAKTIKMVLSCPLTWTQLVLWQHDRTIIMILAMYCTRLHDDRSPCDPKYFGVIFNIL